MLASRRLCTASCAAAPRLGDRDFDEAGQVALPEKVAHLAAAHVVEWQNSECRRLRAVKQVPKHAAREGKDRLVDAELNTIVKCQHYVVRGTRPAAVAQAARAMNRLLYRT